MLNRTLPSILLLFASFCLHAADEVPSSKNKGNETPASSEASNTSARKSKGVSYTFHIDNKINQNNSVDSVLVILDKFDLSGAGIVKRVYYPDAENHIVIEDLPVGKYYAEVYVLGLYKKHYSSVIRTVKSSKKNKAKIHLDYNDAYTPGSANIPAENVRLFSFNK